MLIATPSVQITDSGIVFGGRLTVEEYLAWAHQVLFVWKALPWYIGDTLLYGEQFIGEEYTQVFEEHYSVQTLANYQSVCRRVKPANRRIHELSFAHHETVAALPDDQQAEWLQAAADNAWTRSELRAAISGTRALPPAVTVESPPFDESPFAPQEAKAIVTFDDKMVGLKRILLDAFEANSRQDFMEVARLLDRAIVSLRER